MSEVVSAGIRNSGGQAAGYGYFARRRDGSAGRYLGSGERRVYNTRQLANAGTSRMSQAIRTAGARQAARTRRAFR
ncbi:MAG: hypothetical protein ACI3YI_12035 [Bacteroidaceae bacterium]